MTLNDREISVLLVDLVRLGAEQVMTHRTELLSGNDVGLTSKSLARGESLVTNADLKSEQQMLDLLATRCPNDGIISEERGFISGTSDFTWVLDPLDGTANFARGSQNFGVIAGLMQRDRVVAGAMFLPAIDALYVATLGNGATRNGVAIERQEPRPLAAATIDHSLLHFAGDERRAEQRRTLDIMLAAARGVRCDHSVRYMADTVDSVLDGFVYHSLGLWDIVGTSAILSEVGVKVSDLHGCPLDLSPTRWTPGQLYPTVGASPALHDEMIDALSASATT